MENNDNTQVDTSTIETDTATNNSTEVKEVSAIPYQFIFENIFETSKILGQIAFVDNNEKEGATSNTISIIRMLSNGEKQFFQITVEETKEITIKK